jgi:hypothetical protein
MNSPELFKTSRALVLPLSVNLSSEEMSFRFFASIFFPLVTLIPNNRFILFLWEFIGKGKNYVFALMTVGAVIVSLKIWASAGDPAGFHPYTNKYGVDVNSVG